MSDRVAVMNEGRLVQVADPRGVYERPADPFTAAFVGVMNLLEGWEVGGGQTVRRGPLALRAAGAPPAPVGSRVTVAFRPEEAVLAGKASDATRVNLLPCRADRVEFRGAFVRYYLTLGSADGRTPATLAYRGTPKETVGGLADAGVVVDVPAGEAARLGAGAGDEMRLHVPPECVRLFGGPGEAR